MVTDVGSSLTLLKISIQHCPALLDQQCWTRLNGAKWRIGGWKIAYHFFKVDSTGPTPL